MDTLRVGIALLVIGAILSFLPIFGFGLAGPLMYVGWLLVVVGLILAVMHMMAGSTRRGSRGRTL